MAIKLAELIMQKRADYETVIKSYGKYKSDIDFILKSEGFKNLIISQ